MSTPEDGREEAVPHGEEPESSASSPGEGEEGDVLARLEEAAAAAENERREREALYDRWLRLQAEFENYRKRTRREIDELRERAAEELVRSLLPVVDNLERALDAGAAADEQAKPFVDGVRMVHRQLMQVLGEAGLAPIEALGAPFDPHRHEAVMREETDAFADGHVMEEIQRGYDFNGRVLRPSMVKVAVGRSAEEGAGDEQNHRD